MGIERKHFWIPLLMAVLCFFKLTTTEFSLFYSLFTASFLLFFLWLTLWIAVPKFLRGMTQSFLGNRDTY